MEIVYLETSFISLLVSRPSRDLITAANQKTTQDWWQLRREKFVCVVSSEVMREASEGDPQEVSKRQAVINQLAVVPFSSDAERMMKALLATKVLPPNAQTDGAHIAIAAAASADYLLTWNCRHLANAQIMKRLETEAKRQGWKLPKVCTPVELMGESPYEG